MHVNLPNGHAQQKVACVWKQDDVALCTTRAECWMKRYSFCANFATEAHLTFIFIHLSTLRSFPKLKVSLLRKIPMRDNVKSAHYNTWFQGSLCIVVWSVWALMHSRLCQVHICVLSKTIQVHPTQVLSKIITTQNTHTRPRGWVSK